jgi:hypothetical protein
VAALLTAVAVALVAGAGVSSYFAAGERRRAREAEAEKRAATTAQEDAETKLVDGLLRPLGREEGPLNAAEVEALWEVPRLSEGELRRFFERGLATRASALRLARRSPELARAAGLDRGRRDLVREVLLAKLRDGGGEQGVKEVCVALGVELELKYDEFAKEAAPVLLQAMRNTENAGELAELAKAAVAAQVGPKEAEAAAARVMRVIVESAASGEDTLGWEGLEVLASAVGPPGSRRGHGRPRMGGTRGAGIRGGGAGEANGAG